MTTSLSFGCDQRRWWALGALWERGDYGPKRKRLTGQGDAGNPVDLEWYRRTGHLVLEGELGDDSVIVVITPYTQGRMTLRDVEDTEVLGVLAQPRSAHGTGKTSGRYEVAGVTDRGRIRVVYERPARDVVLVITVYPESE